MLKGGKIKHIQFESEYTLLKTTVLIDIVLQLHSSKGSDDIKIIQRSDDILTKV